MMNAAVNSKIHSHVPFKNQTELEAMTWQVSGGYIYDWNVVRGSMVGVYK